VEGDREAYLVTVVFFDEVVHEDGVFFGDAGCAEGLAGLAEGEGRMKSRRKGHERRGRVR
jgi:hypothetical protein